MVQRRLPIDLCVVSLLKNSILPASGFDHYFQLVKLPKNDPSFEHITGKAFLILELPKPVGV